MEKKIFAVGVFLLVGLLATSVVMAYQGDPSVKGPEFSEERHVAMQDAFENLDYQAWSDLMAETGRGSKIVQAISEDNFVDFVEAKELAMAGDLSAMNELKAELGLGLGQMKHGNGNALGKGQGLGKGQRNYFNA